MSLTLATQITILRIICAPFLVWLLYKGYLGWAMLVFGLASLTDTFDGIVARKFGQESDIGSILDPVADKVLLTTAFVSLSVPSFNLANSIPLWLVLIAIVRDAMIGVGAWLIRILRGRKDFPPSFFGKVSTAFQMITVCVSLVGNYEGKRWLIFDPLIYATLVFTFVSGMDYFRRGVVMMRNPELKQELS